MTDPRAVHDAAWRGELSAALPLAASLSGAAAADSRAWALALDAIAWHAGAGGRLPEPDSAGALGDADPAARLPACLACVHGAHAALLACDRDGLAAWTDRVGRLAAGHQDPEPSTWHQVLAGFVELWDGRASSALERGRAAATAAGRAKIAPLVLESTALAALAALAAGAAEEAVSLARRASRMARTEALPWSEYLANVTLARVRRHCGKPHMAIHILRALARVVPAPWHGWLAWESRLAVGPGEAVLEAEPSAPSTALGELLEAARRGRHRPFREAAERCRRRVAGVAPLSSELAALVAALDPVIEPGDAPAELRPWMCGEAPAIPAGLQGLASPAPDGETTGGVGGPAAFVVARGGRTTNARRLLGLGGALAGARVDSGRRPGRIEAAISALALAGEPGLTRAELFAAVYGFAYVPVRHQGVLDVLLHRVRGELSPRSSLDRKGDRLLLVAPEGLVVADPRCGGPEDDQLLRVLAARGSGTAKAAAEALGVPLRTAQAALQALVQEGVCVVERRGRQVEYRVEDTTFSEPTQR